MEIQLGNDIFLKVFQLRYLFHSEFMFARKEKVLIQTTANKVCLTAEVSFLSQWDISQHSLVYPVVNICVF